MKSLESRGESSGGGDKKESRARLWLVQALFLLGLPLPQRRE